MPKMSLYFYSLVLEFRCCYSISINYVSVLNMLLLFDRKMALPGLDLLARETSREERRMPALQLIHHVIAACRRKHHVISRVYATLRYVQFVCSGDSMRFNKIKARSLLYAYVYHASPKNLREKVFSNQAL